MKHTLGASAVGLTIVLGGLGSAVAAESATCFDRPATIIGTDGDDRLRGTDGPDVIVDAATLTGAALVALGKTCSAYYATEDDLAVALEGAVGDATSRC